MLAIQSAGMAQEVLKLDEVLKIIAQDNLELKSYGNIIKSQDEAVKGAKAQPAPMVGVGNFRTPYPAKGSSNNVEKGDFMITADQEIINPAKLKANENYLKSKSAVTNYQQQANYNELKANAKSLYYEMIIATKQLQFIESQARILSNLKKLAEIRYPYNKGNLNTIFEADAKIYEMENDKLMLKSKIDANLIRLNLMMNKPSSYQFKVDTAMMIHFIPAKNISSELLQNRVSEVKQLDEQIKSSQLNTKLLQQQFKPDLKIGFDHMTPYGGMPLNYSARVGVSIPIAPWSVKSYKSAIKTNEFEVLAMQNQKEAMLNNLTAIIKSTEVELIYHEHRHENFEEKIIPSMKKNLELMMLNYQENKAELPMVLEAWQGLNNAQMSYLNELNEYYQTIVQYEKALEI
ncbi:TolC family protein [Pelobium sp.]|nr:TolC family protein [Pelobium sp.]MDA9554925.1 TolC family protein [Pelobium sp.]